jgi:hypothetical protein
LVLDKREIIIKDACILFDLVDLNLLEDFFQLEVSAFTTPQVIGEITDETQWNVISKFIEIEKLKIDAEGKYEVIAQLYDENPGLSIADSSVLEIAIRKNAIIYSSDGILRKISVKRDITVRGVLWIIEELYKREILSREIAIEKLNLYEKINQRAPIKEILVLKNKMQ